MTLYNLYVCNTCSKQWPRLDNEKLCPYCKSRDIELLQGPAVDSPEGEEK